MRVYVYEDRNDRVCPFSPVVITSPASLIFAISVSKPIIARTMRILISQSGYSKIHSSFDRRVRRIFVIFFSSFLSFFLKKGLKIYNKQSLRRSISSSNKILDHSRIFRETSAF